ncbi:glycosyltransferase [Sulfurisphaera ohwakuensis]|uniref:glycosyltransferase n=1 Tax=Sulfurisphaera ohwakuensis TaxID=69656 RepID=UPI0036F3FB30
MSNKEELTLVFLGHSQYGKRGGIRIFESLTEVCKEKGINTIVSTVITNRNSMGISDLDILIKQYAQINNILKKVKGRVIIITSTEMFADILPAILIKLKRRNVKLVAPIYHFVIPKFRQKLDYGALFHVFIQKLEILLVTKFFDGIITENSYVEKVLLNKNPRLKIIKKSPGVNKIFMIDNEKVKKDIDAVFLGALTKFKGVFDLLEVWKDINKDGKFKLVIAGYADYNTVQSVNDYIVHNSIRNVELKPNISEEEKFKLLDRAKLYVLPSYVEGIPITFYEAWSRRAVVVTYYLPTYIDIKDYIIAARLGDLNDLKEKILYALENYDDIVRKVANNAMKYSIEHEFEKVTSEMCEEILKF